MSQDAQPAAGPTAPTPSEPAPPAATPTAPAVVTSPAAPALPRQEDAKVITLSEHDSRISKLVEKKDAEYKTKEAALLAERDALKAQADRVTQLEADKKALVERQVPAALRSTYDALKPEAQMGWLLNELPKLAPAPAVQPSGAGASVVPAAGGDRIVDGQDGNVAFRDEFRCVNADELAANPEKKARLMKGATGEIPLRNRTS